LLIFDPKNLVQPILTQNSVKLKNKLKASFKVFARKKKEKLEKKRKRDENFQEIKNEELTLNQYYDLLDDLIQTNSKLEGEEKKLAVDTAVKQLLVFDPVQKNYIAPKKRILFNKLNLN
jgi:hypothetical protein